MHEAKQLKHYFTIFDSRGDDCLCQNLTGLTRRLLLVVFGKVSIIFIIA